MKPDWDLTVFLLYNTLFESYFERCPKMASFRAPGPRVWASLLGPGHTRHGREHPRWVPGPAQTLRRHPAPIRGGGIATKS